jgi:hypothetical protein
MLTSVEVGRIVLFQSLEQPCAAMLKRAERCHFEILTTTAEDELPEALGSATQGVLVLCSYSPDTHAVVARLRASKAWKRLPIFAIVPDELITSGVLKQANGAQIELLPTSVPESRRWEKLREAHDVVRGGGRWLVRNQRAHYRLPLKAKATLMANAETVDISEGGIAFLTNQPYRVGDVGRIDVRALLGDMDESERGFPFEVVAVKSVRQEGYRYFVGAQFIHLSSAARERLKAALEVIEPTEHDGD